MQQGDDDDARGMMLLVLRVLLYLSQMKCNKFRVRTRLSIKLFMPKFVTRMPNQLSAINLEIKGVTLRITEIALQDVRKYTAHPTAC
jgi:hypothetical protein